MGLVGGVQTETGNHETHERHEKEMMGKFVTTEAPRPGGLGGERFLFGGVVGLEFTPGAQSVLDAGVITERILGIPRWVVGELGGTFVLIFLGLGSGAWAVTNGAVLWGVPVPVVWGLAVALAVWGARGLSGAHLNPAMSVALAVQGHFPWRRVPGYVVAQLGGAIAGSAVVYGLFHAQVAAYEARIGVVRGAAGSEATAMIFGEYFPHPHGLPLTAERRAGVSTTEAFLAEMAGTAALALVAFWCGDARRSSRVRALAPGIIGLTVTALIAIISPLTMADFNPARDFGPRLFSYFAGWGPVVFTTNGTGWLTVYVLAPVVGAAAAAKIFLSKKTE